MAFPANPAKYDIHTEDEINYQAPAPGYWSKAGTGDGAVWSDSNFGTNVNAIDAQLSKKATKFIAVNASLTCVNNQHVYFYFADANGTPHGITAQSLPEVQMWLNWGSHGHQVMNAMSAWNVTYQYGVPFNRTDNVNYQPRAGEIMTIEMRITELLDSVNIHFRANYVSKDVSMMYCVGFARQVLTLDQIGKVVFSAPFGTFRDSTTLTRYF